MIMRTIARFVLWSGVMAAMTLSSAIAQIGSPPPQPERIQINTGSAGAAPNYQDVSTTNPLPVSGSFSATLSGFTPGGSYSTPLSVSNSSSNVALPTGTVVAVYNTGTSQAAYCKLGNSSVSATTSDDFIPPSSAIGFTVGSNTYIACITSSSTTTVNVSGGSGLLTGFGGGGGSGGGNAAASATGSAVPADAGYTGLNNGGNLIGWIGDSSGRGIVAGAGTAGTPAGGVLTVQGVASMTPILANPGTAANWGFGTAGSPSSTVQSIQGVSGGTAVPVSGTFYQTTQPVSIASAQIASGAIASGALASGAGTDGWNVTEGTKADTVCATATGTCSEIALLKYLNNQISTLTQYPTGSTASQGSTTGTTSATSTTLAAVSSHTQYVCGFSIRANATAAATGNATLSDGTITLNFTQWTAPLASGIGIVEQIFNPCKPASAADTAWTLTSAAPGSGGVVSVAIWGYYL